MMRAVLCLSALCCVSAWADDKPKPQTAEDAAKALSEAMASKAPVKTLADLMKRQEKILEAAENVLSANGASKEDVEKALVAKAQALTSLPTARIDGRLDKYAKELEESHPKSAAVPLVQSFIQAAKYRSKYFAKRPEKVDPAALAELKELAAKYPKNAAWASYYGAYATLTEQNEGAKAAIAFIEDGLKLFPENRQLKSQLKGLKIIGQPLEIVGPTLEGSEYNLANLKGKVVLVDFWATWCGPCIAELPHVKEAYEKYHEKGFEIVGVSLDRKRDALEKFIKDKEMPWPQIIFSKDEEMFWNNPVARKHEINSIPATYLIGRDGKVAARNLRGKALEEAVKKEIAKSAPSAN
jgi:thiol-disulfide isomerase/thioredoxin